MPEQHPAFLTFSSPEDRSSANLSTSISLRKTWPTAQRVMPIDVLIGSDFYWQFMTGETVQNKRTVARYPHSRVDLDVEPN